MGRPEKKKKKDQGQTYSFLDVRKSGWKMTRGWRW